MLISRKADVNKADDCGTTPLHGACQGGHVPVIELLMSKGAQIESKDKRRKSPLHTAAIYGQREAAACLLDHGANVNASDDMGHTPLMYAVEEKQLPLVELLLSRGADPNIRKVNQSDPEDDTEGMTALHISMKSHWKIVACLLEGGADMNVVDKTGGTPLHYATTKDDIKLLVTKGADINKLSAGIIGSGLTPLQIAKLNGHEKIADYLTKMGASGEVPIDVMGMNLFYSALDGDVQIMRRLIQNGADVNHIARRMSQGEEVTSTSLIQSAARGDLDVVRLLIENKADVNLADNDGRTPLFMAVQCKGKVPVMELLISNGAEVNSNEKVLGLTPLHMAALEGKKELAKCLLDHGAEINQQNKDGESPLFSAADSGYLDVVMLLIQCGANIHQATHKGMTPLIAAALQGYVCIVEQLIKNGADFDDQGGERVKACKCCGATDVPVFKCKGCKIIYYCSPECQMKDWKEGDEPDNRHKSQCPSIKKLNEKYKMKK